MASLTDITLALFTLTAVLALLLLLPEKREELVCLKAIDDALACMERNCSLTLPRPVTFSEGSVCCGRLCFYGNTSLRGTYSHLLCIEGECEGPN